jgi:hypothetical protein
MSYTFEKYENVCTEEEIQNVLSHPETVQARTRMDAMASGSVYFTLPLSAELKASIQTRMGIDLGDVEAIPMRWIKGDMVPHVDTGTSVFEKTYLAYITTCPGEFLLGGDSYPMTSGTGYSFSEGLSHETRHTGLEPRLLLGPMSEQGQAVGIFMIEGAGGTTIYIRQNGDDMETSTDQTNWNIMYWPCAIQNTDTSAGVLTVEFVSDIRLFLGTNQYFQVFTEKIQIGSRSLKQDGTRPVITVDGITNYPGFIRNGDEYGDGYNNVYVYNLDVRATNGSTVFFTTDTIAIGGGWVCQAYFGKNASNNYVINCTSDGPIPSYGGGIIGGRAGSEANATLTVIGCSSSGASDNRSGGIIGVACGISNGEVICRECWSTGAIGEAAGGIIGGAGATGRGSLSVSRCYSTGVIGLGGGGIAGFGTGIGPGSNHGTVTITACYSTGAIGQYAGGITGTSAEGLTITNCYSTGNIGDTAGGICGNAPQEFIPITNCYTTGTITGSTGYIQGSINTVPASCYSEAYVGSSGWNAAHANSVLTGLPDSIVGTSWVAAYVNQPYEVRMGYTPYSREMITESPRALRLSYDQTVSPGGSSVPAIAANRSYQILYITGGSQSSYGSISINPVTGVISTSSATEQGTYTIYVHNEGSYYISLFNLTVSGACCQRPIAWSILSDDRARVDVIAGNILIGSFNDRRGPMSYADLMRMKMAYAAKM